MTKNGETLETSTGWHRRALLALSLAVLAPWGLGFWFPDRWWGSHFLAFLPGPWVVGMVGAALAILVFYPRLPTRSSVPSPWGSVTPSLAIY
jgi:hypothetical protein